MLDRETKKRFKISKPHMIRLIDYIESGHRFDRPDDVPEDVLRMLRLEDQQKLEHQSKVSLGKYPPINITNVLPGSSTEGSIVVSSGSQPSSSTMNGVGQLCTDVDITGPLDEPVLQYCSWLASKFTRRNLKEEVHKIGTISLDEGLDLVLIYEAQNPSFFIEKGIKPGSAQRFVRDIPEWARMHGIRDDISE